MTKLNLKEIRELHQSTMLPPWNYNGGKTKTIFPLYSRNEHFGSTEFEEEAKFICWAKNNLPALLDWAERAKDLIESFVEYLDCDEPEGCECITCVGAQLLSELEVSK